MSNVSFTQLFSRRLIGLRNRLGLSQQALADKAGVHLRSVQGWEKDGVIPHGKTLHNLAAVLGVEVTYLTQEEVSALRETPPPPAPPVKPSPYSFMEVETLLKHFHDLTRKLTNATAHERKYIIGNLRDMLDELEARELTPGPLDIEAKKKLVEEAGKKALADLQHKTKPR